MLVLNHPHPHPPEPEPQEPPPPPAEPESISKQVTNAKVDASGRRVLVGEMCPQGAGGRPAVAPLIMRGVSWIDTAAEVAARYAAGLVIDARGKVVMPGLINGHTHLCMTFARSFFRSRAVGCSRYSTAA